MTEKGILSEVYKARIISILSEVWAHRYESCEVVFNDILSALASTPDEELVEKVAIYLFNNRQMAYTEAPKWDEIGGDDRAEWRQVAKQILSIIQPYLTSRAEKYEQEAVARVVKTAKEAVKQAVRTVFQDTLEMHIADRDELDEVGEWAECQDVGVFVWFPESKWQSLQEGKSLPEERRMKKPVKCPYDNKHCNIVHRVCFLCYRYGSKQPGGEK